MSTERSRKIWHVIAGRDQLWRKGDASEDVVDVAPSVSLTLPVGARFQFRNHSNEMAQIIAVTLRPWPGEGEAIATAGLWPIKF